MNDVVRCINQFNNVVSCPGPEPVIWGYGWIFWIVLALVGVWILWGLVFGPRWNVWAQHQDGLADLANARNEQQVQVAQAQGRLDAANLNKQAAIVEAEAVAEQINRIGAGLTQHDLYLKWQWIKMMEERPKNSVIYVPTEAGLPILEAGKRSAST
jgi:hypothetical protein